MRVRYLAAIVCSALVVSDLMAGDPAAAKDASPPLAGRIEMKVALVAGDLSVRPVPKRLFEVACADPGCSAKETLTTDFGGAAARDLPPGRYVLTSVTPLEFEGNKFSWLIPFEIQAGATVQLELSNDNANMEHVSVAMPDGSSPVPTEGEVFRKVKGSVFKVISASGHGSGFLVDPAGLVLTNHHVVQGSDYLAVKVDAKRKYRAVLLAEDPNNDLAVIMVNPEATRGLQALPLSGDTSAKSSVSVGERVIAVGSPVATEGIMTTGIVSKVEEGVIYSDVSINSGNSGGPLFDARGEVIGVNTFGLTATVGPGVAGIVRIHVARALISEAQAKLATAEPPEARLLPEASDFRFPADVLKNLALSSTLNPTQYHLEAGRLDVQFVTPVLTAGLEVQAEKEAVEANKKRTRKGTAEYKAGEDFYEWRRYAGDYRPVVVIQAIPEIGMTGGSAFAVIMLGPNVPQNYRFKTDFKRMDLLRDGTVVEPIHPGRAPQVVNEQQGFVSVKDVGYFGRYEYPPEAFRPGAKLELRIWEVGRPDAKLREIPGPIKDRVWSDFKPYFEALQETVAKPE